MLEKFQLKMSNMSKALKYALIWLLLLVGITLVFDIGNRLSSFGTGGDFFMIVFWSSMISGVFTLILRANED